MEGVFLPASSLVLVGGGVVPITANNFERLSNKTSNKWRDMIKVKAPAGAGPGRRCPSLREWAAKLGVALGDPDVEEACAACTVPYDDERVPLDGVGVEPAIEEGWVGIEDPASGGFAVGYVWTDARGDLMFISVHPEHTNKREPGAKRPAPRDSGHGGGGGGGGKKRRTEREPRARLFNPAMQRWFALGGEALPHPERLELLTHPQAMPTLMQAPRDVVAALQRKLDDAECGVQYDLRLEELSAEHKRQIKVAKDKEGRSDGSIRVSGPVTKYADAGDLSKDGFLRRPDAVARAILAMITSRGDDDDGGGGASGGGGGGGGVAAAPRVSEAAASVGGAPSASAAPRVRLPIRMRQQAGAPAQRQQLQQLQLLQQQRQAQQARQQQQQQQQEPLPMYQAPLHQQQPYYHHHQQHHHQQQQPLGPLGFPGAAADSAAPRGLASAPPGLGLRGASPSAFGTSECGPLAPASAAAAPPALGYAGAAAAAAAAGHTAHTALACLPPLGSPGGADALDWATWGESAEAAGPLCGGGDNLLFAASPCGAPGLGAAAAAAAEEGVGGAAGASPGGLWGSPGCDLASDEDQLTAAAAGCSPALRAAPLAPPAAPRAAAPQQLPPGLKRPAGALAPAPAPAPPASAATATAATAATASAFEEYYDHLSDGQLEELAWEAAARLSEIHAALYLRDTQRRAAAAAAAAGAAGAGAGGAPLAHALALPAAKRARSM
ncbi:MAG: hypothetical protein J3K34DRAFT_197451 [Monoraphidium minutum]|nr:MAG: hypothetical protein J3K34DRAFT_197451 [Monoraphidium minutum]